MCSVHSIAIFQCRHYQLYIRYVQRTNQLIENTIFENATLSMIVMTAPYKSELYNQSTQAYNHAFEWKILWYVTLD